jgi:hypothetical protein
MGLSLTYLDIICFMRGKLISVGNLKEGKNEAVPEEPGKRGYTEP